MTVIKTAIEDHFLNLIIRIEGKCKTDVTCLKCPLSKDCLSVQSEKRLTPGERVQRASTILVERLLEEETT